MRVKMRWLFPVFTIFVCLVFVFPGCKSYEEQKKELADTKDRGTIHISADETFKPIIDAQVKVYEANHPGTKIIVHYKPEAECLKDLGVDSIRMVIATRGFSRGEEQFIMDSLKVGPAKLVVARDAIAVIVHPRSEDSLFSMKEIREILTGKFNRDLIPVFDGVQATSTVRFIVDSILKDEPLSPKAVAARSSTGVIDYVAKTPGTVGFLGVSWIGNKEDSSQLSFLKKVKMVHLESTDNPDQYVLPYQVNIYMMNYPMVRDLVYNLKEGHQGLGRGFANFLSGEIGQLIFKRAYLVPARNNFILREARLRE
jgi:phosphate transport system substrate-binding protein